MRILMVSEDVPEPAMGGLARHAVTLAAALADAGHEVDFLGRSVSESEIPIQPLKLPGRLFLELPNLSGGWKELLTGMYNPFKRPVLAWKLSRAILARAQGYDVIHYHGHFPNVAAFIPSGINFVQTRHDQGSDCLTHTRFRNGSICTATDPAICAGCITEKPNVFQRLVSAWAVRLYRHQVSQGFRRHKTIFVSEMLRRNFVRTAGSGNWGSVIHNFIETTGIKEALATVGHLVLAGERKIEIVVAGKLYPPKGVDRFLNFAVGQLPTDMHITVIGSGPDEPELRSKYEGNEVSFLGWMDYNSIIRCIAWSDAVVVPSICEESCSTIVLEALVLGRTVLALNMGGTPELSIYSSQNDQLRLYPEMSSLIVGLANVKTGSRAENLVNNSSCVAEKIPALLKLYES